MEKLPSGIIQHLLDFLPIHSAANLALSNRRLRSLITKVSDPFEELRQLGNEGERAKFLQNYDIHHPDEVVCPACGVFHRRLPQRPHRRYIWGGVLKHVVCKKEKRDFPETLILWRTYYRWLTFHLGFRYSPQHGIPTHLNDFSKMPLLSLACDSLAIEVDNRLLLRHRESMGQAGDDEYWDDKEVVRNLCPHMRSSIMNYKDFIREANHAAKIIPELKKSSPGKGFTYKTHRCSECPTEIRIEICPTHLFQGRIKSQMAKYEYILSLVRYIDLGQCKSPDELEWRSVSTWAGSPSDPGWWLPRSARRAEKIADQDRVAIDLTHMEPISERFERSVRLRPPLEPYHNAPWHQPPQYGTDSRSDHGKDTRDEKGA
ncbi:hypothetical protein P154DRAFT_537453 [Amniculicola lignicola CBS 123094]|uniref:F-box domain-containing protein n=1 Tax=Amniculicola lignicola CBS 123094 TaxID=1392246 RepID=A0A6A5WDC1_9PLEO|nr:hypothetical protein P154DRAFT_537453 [Amniculicola lignicola CBS 123094]